MCSTALFFKDYKAQEYQWAWALGWPGLLRSLQAGQDQPCLFNDRAWAHTIAAHCLLTTEPSPPDLHLNIANEQAPQNLEPSFSNTLPSAATFTNLKIKTHGIVCFCQMQIGLGFSGVQFVPHAALFFLFSFLTLKIGPVPRDGRRAGLDYCA